MCLITALVALEQAAAAVGRLLPDEAADQPSAEGLQELIVRWAQH
jgi:hypothetical protein